MKQYLLFAGDNYYPSGGWGDFIKSFESLEDAKEVGAKYSGNFTWWHVVDVNTGEVVVTTD